MKPYSLLNTILIAVVDICFCWISWLGAVFVFTYLFRNSVLLYTPESLSLIEVINGMAWVIVIACPLFYYLCGVYRSLWRHPGTGSLIRITAAVFLTSFTFYVALRLRLGYWASPGLGMMAFYFLLTLSFFVRIFPRVIYIISMYIRSRGFIGKYFGGRKNQAQAEPIRTLIIGAGESASSFLLNASQQGSRPRKIIGILDNDPHKHGYKLHGIRVYGDDSKIPELCREFDIDEIVVAVPSMPNEDLRRIVSLAPSRCKVRMLAGLSSDKAGERLRDINIGDLLGREEANLDISGIGAWVMGKTALVTGGGGSIGSEICRQLLLFDVGKIVIYDISENNAYNLKEELAVKFENKGRFKVAARIGSVQDKARLDEVFNEFKPDIVFHAAAYKHVPLMEECPRLAFENNVIGTRLAAECAVAHGAGRFVMISTDKAVNPTSVMGASKRLAELVVLDMNHLGKTEFVCVRFGNVLDSNGSVIPKFKRQIEAGGPVTVTHPDIIRFFMTISEAARLVLEAGAMARGGEIFILDMGQPVKITDLAESLIRMAGLTPGVDIQIEFVGLRPGEKLYEELLLNEEGLTMTRNDKIFVLSPGIPAEFAAFPAFLEEYTKDSISNGEEIKEVLKRFVPEYQGDEEQS